MSGARLTEVPGRRGAEHEGRFVDAQTDDARWNLVDNFRSVVVLAERNGETGELLPSLEAVGRWLGEFNAAYLEANHLVNDGRLHALTGRRLVLAGDELLPEFAAVTRLVEVARRCGLATLLALSLDGVRRHPLALAELRSAQPNLQLQLDCTLLQDDDLAPERRAALTAALNTYAQSGGELNLLGAVEPLRAAGLTRSEVFNRAGFTVSARAATVRPMHRLHRVAPCREFLGLYIDRNHDIYPCAGMMGHEPSRFGSVSRPFSDLFDALGRTRRAIDHLAPRGPRLEAPPSAFPGDLCALHRQAVDSLEAL